MDQAAESAFIKTEAGGAIEPAKARPADRADPLSVKWIRVDEWSITTGTKVFRFKRRWGGNAGGADGNTRPLGERAFTDPAFVWEEQRKNAVRDCPEG
jgi:hypothetical protein